MGALEPWTGPGVRALSPDDLVPALRAEYPGESELGLVRRAQAVSDVTINAAVDAGRTVMVETVLSSKKFEATVGRALATGFRFGLFYVVVGSPELNVGRVADRVEQGGHDVSAELIRSRRIRSFAAFTWFAARASVGAVFDNSGEAPGLIAEKREGEAAWRSLDPLMLATLGLHLAA